MSLKIIIKFLAATSTVTNSSAFLSFSPVQEHCRLYYHYARFPSNHNLSIHTSNIRSSVFLTAEKYIYDDQSRNGKKKREEQLVEGIRLNKVFKATHSRRAADTLIGSGRVSVNGKQVLEKGGFRVVPYQDVVKLDGIVVTGWEDMNAVPTPTVNDRSNDKKSTLSSREVKLEAIAPPEGSMSHFEYVKYWKPLGVTCTTDSTVRNNIIDSITLRGYNPKHRVYPVGRLDKETTGLILLTSDGRLPNAVLRGEKKQPKVYQVLLDRNITDEDIIKLQRGIIITTIAQRDGKRAEPLTCRTKSCEVRRLGPRNFEITLTEGRNRQIRKMVGALNYTVITLQRVEFMGITLQSSGELSSSNLKGPGDWAYLEGKELSVVKYALAIPSN